MSEVKASERVPAAPDHPAEPEPARGLDPSGGCSSRGPIAIDLNNLRDLSDAATPSEWRYAPGPNFDEADITAKAHGYQADLGNFYCATGADEFEPLPGKANAAMAAMSVNFVRELLAAQADGSVTVSIRLMPRPGGGLRVASDTLPGLMLSGADQHAVAQDIGPAILGMLAHDGRWPASAPEAGTAETRSGSVHEGATRRGTP